MRLTARARRAAIAAVLAMPLVGGITVAASGPAAAASVPAPATGARHAPAPARAGVPAALARAIRASHGSAARLHLASPLAWSQTAELTETSGCADDHYGWSVAISSDGTTAAVGAPAYPACTSGSGAVFVYQKVSGKWTETAHLTGGSSEFGWSVSVSANGSSIVVGSPSNGGFFVGGVFFYSDSGGLWKQTASFPATPAGAREELGSSVAISENGTTAAAVAGDYPGSGTDTGAVFVYQLSSTGWKQTATLTRTSANAIGSTYNTQEVALSAKGTTLVVGNPLASSDTGSVFVFTHTSTGKWVQTATLTASDGPAGYEFGGAVAISADGSTIVAAPKDQGLTQDAAYVFSHASGSWKQTGELSNAVNSVAVSADGSELLVGNEGANSFVGEGFLYKLSAGKWTQTTTLNPSDQSLPGGYFGTGVALSCGGSIALVGAPDQTDGSASQEGAAYVFVS